MALEGVRAGDTFVVWKLDRLGRALSPLGETVQALHQQRRHFKSLQEHIDTTSGAGTLIFHLFAALAEFARDLLRERTRAGLGYGQE
jgi:DNA invertase Pin-like site-specific DNA recombinase